MTKRFTNRSLSRRTFLRAAGFTLGLPWLDAMRPAVARGAETRQPPRRMIAIQTNMGILPQFFFPEGAGTAHGVHIVVGGDERHVLAPLAPGLIRSVPIAAARLLEPGARVALRDEPCIVALDGEREIELFRPGHGLEVAYNPDGPFVVDIPTAIRAGAEAGAFEG